MVTQHWKGHPHYLRSGGILILHIAVLVMVLFDCLNQLFLRIYITQDANAVFSLMFIKQLTWITFSLSGFHSWPTFLFFFFFLPSSKVYIFSFTIFCSSNYHPPLPKPHDPTLLPPATGLLHPALPSRAVGAQAPRERVAEWKAAAELDQISAVPLHSFIPFSIIY